MSGTRKPTPRTTSGAAKDSTAAVAPSDTEQVKAQSEAAGQGDIAATAASATIEEATADPSADASEADASGDESSNDDDDAPDGDAPVPCEEHFPLGFPEGATSVGCEHGQWAL